MNKIKNHFYNLFKFLIALSVLFGLVWLTGWDSYPLYFISVIGISVPIIFYSCYKLTIAKTSKLIGMINPKDGQKHLRTFYYNITKRKTIGYIFNIIVGLFFGFTIPVYLLCLKTKDLFVVVGILILAYVAKCIIDMMAPIYDKDHEIKNKITKMRWFDGIVLILGSIVFGAFAYWLYKIDLNFQLFSNFSFENNKIAYSIKCCLEDIDLIPTAMLENDTTKNLLQPLNMVVTILVLQCGALFFGLVHYFQTFTFSFTDLRMIFISVEDIVDSISQKTLPKSKNKKTWLLFWGIYFIIFFFITFTGWYILDKKQYVEKIEIEFGLICEEISGAFYKVGTAAQVQNIVNKTFYGETRVALENEVNKYFDDMTLNIDNYLDYYYGMGHEIQETVAMVADLAAGTIKDTVNSKMNELMENGINEKLMPSYQLENVIETTLIEGQRKLNEQVDVILQKNLITRTKDGYEIKVHTSFDDIYNNTSPGSTIKPSRKLGVSFITGGVAFGAAKFSTHIAKRISKTIGKKVAKEAAEEVVEKGVKMGAKKALPKVLSAVSKLAGPIGIAIGVGTEFGMLKLDEFLNRDEYKQDLINTIQNERNYYMNKINEYFI